MPILTDDEKKEADDAGAAAGARPPAAHRAVARAREALAGACVGCPEADGPLRREMLCRCPVALSLRLLHHVERHGTDGGELSARERAALDFQERALARRLPPLDIVAVRRALRILQQDEGAHASCAGGECLRCRSARTLEALDRTEGRKGVGDGGGSCG